ncbi:MAG: HNH endonuclease signature motif containing protein [Candidatus Bathyarchaeota archaeon]|jgi:hypothetical protein|nr:HNH endonuclease signature motif containing protein [Candidatus Bathyarchaeota archaeon]
MPLNSAEKLNANLREVRDVVFELSKHKFFSLSGLPEYRFFRRYVAAQIMLLESKGGPSNAKFPNLRAMYQSPAGDLKTESVRKILNYLVKESGVSASSIVNSADFVTLFMLTSRLMKGYSLTNHAGSIRDFYNEFLLTVGQTSSAQSEKDLPFWNYKTWRKTSADSKASIEQRLRIMITEFHKTYPDLPQKDPQREFDYWQRLAIFDKAKGCCQGSCPPGTYIRFEEGQYHHVKRWIDGGTTTVENGQSLCAACHQRVHAGGTEE